MRTFQSFTALGTLGKDPEVRSVATGKKVANFTIVTEETYTSNGEEKKTADWHRVTAWGELALIAEAHLRKGVQCFVRGKVKTRSYDGNDGQKKYITEIQAEVILPALRAPKDGAAPQQRSAGAPSSTPPKDAYGEDLPF